MVQVEMFSFKFGLRFTYPFETGTGNCAFNFARCDWEPVLVHPRSAISVRTAQKMVNLLMGVSSLIERWQLRELAV